MFFQGKLLVFLAGVLSCIWAKPHLQDNGYHDILVYVGHDVPDEDARVVVNQVKELLTEASQDMYYANQGRVYIKEVTIVVPNHWTEDMVDDLSGETVRGEIYKEADIQISRKSKLMGEAPYVQQIKGDCGAPDYEQPGEPMQVSVEYLRNLHYKRAETIVSYGPMGKLITQEFAKYHHGIYEEYGYPGDRENEKNRELFPSIYLNSCEDEKGNKRTCAVENYCSDVPLNGEKRSYIPSTGAPQECVIDDQTGEIISEYCYFTADNEGQTAIASIGSYQYTNWVTTFCDGSDAMPHNHEAPNLHNEYCEGVTQMDTILGHREFADGNNEPVYINDTTPTFFTKKQASARFVLVVDYSGSMASNAKMDHLHTSAVRWVTQLRPGTLVSIVKFGSAGQVVTGWLDANKDQVKLIDFIRSIGTNGGGTNMGAGLKKAEELVTDPNAPGHGGVVLVFTDGQVNQGPDIGSAAVYNPFKRSSVRVNTVLMGTKKTAKIETLARETKGKVFTVNYDGSDLDVPFAYASETWIPPEVADGYDWTIHDKFLPGTEAVACAALGKACFNDTIEVDDQTNANVEVVMRLTQNNANPLIEDYFDIAFVKDSAEQLVSSFKYKVDRRTNEAKLTSHGLTPKGKYKVEVELKKPLLPVPIFFASQIKATAKRSDSNAEPYVITCEYPKSWKQDNKFLITGKVTQGTTVVKGAIVHARISKSMDEEPTGEADKSCMIQLQDDGLTADSGDLHALDGFHSYILDPRESCWNDIDLTKADRLQVMCTMVSNEDTKVDENDFFTKKNEDNRGVPMDNNEKVEPYCCGSSEQAWFKRYDVDHVDRHLLDASSVKNELPTYQTREEWFSADFGPPGRISDLKATRVGDRQSGVIQLTWTGAGADPGYGTPAHYDVHYSTKRSNLYTKNMKTRSSPVTALMLTAGSLEPVRKGQKMSITVKIPDLEVPGTYHFAVRAVDPHGNEAKSSNIVSVHFHDGSPILKDVSPHHVHGIPQVEMPLIEKLRKFYPDERIVQGALKRAEHNQKMVMEAENTVMEQRLRKRFGDNEKVLAKITNTINTNPEQRELYKKILL